MKPLAAIALAVPAVLPMSGLAQTIDWAAANSGTWSTVGNWNPQNVPDNANESARLALGSPYTVTVNNTYTIGALLQTNASALLDVPSTRSLTLSADSTINGVVRLNSDVSTNTAFLKFDGLLSLDGSGELRLFSSGGDANDATLAAATNDDSLTIADGFTIRGSGRISLPFINNGLVVADAGQGSAFQFFGSGGTTNNTLIKAIGATTLTFSSTKVAQGPNGVIESAQGSAVNFTLTTLTGGSLRTTGNGVFRTTPGESSLNGVKNLGLFEVMDSTNLRVIGGGLINDGTIRVNPNHQSGPASINFDDAEDAAVSGKGRIILGAAPGDLSKARLTGFGSGTNTLGHTLAGTGRIDAAITNHGTIAPGDPVGVLQFTIGPWVQSPTGIFQVSVAGPGPEDYDRAKITGAVQLAGKLEVVLENGYVPSICDPYIILDAVNTIQGTFDEVVGPDIEGGVWRAVYKDNTVELVLTCYADMLADCELNLFDFLEFVNLFNEEALAAECDGDGEYTLFDFLCFVNLFNEGC